MNLLTLKILFTAIYFVHTLIMFKIIEQPMKLKGGNITKFLVCIINTVTHMYLLETVPMSGYIQFLILLTLYVTEIFIFFNASVLQKLAFGLIPIIHIMAGSFIVTFVYATYMRFDFTNVQYGTEFLISIRIAVCIVICLCVLTILRVAHKRHWDIIKFSPKRLIAFFVLQVLQTIQMFVTSIMFYQDIYSKVATKTLLWSAMANLVIFYTAIFMIIGIEILKDRKIKFKAKELEEMYKDILTHKADHTMEIEVNVTTKIITNYRFCGEFQSNVVGEVYDKFIRDVVYTRIHPEDRKEMLNSISSHALLKNLSHKTEFFEYEYRTSDANGKYSWYLAYLKIERDPKTNIVRGILVGNNIQAEKDLQYSATHDALSGLYNKRMTQKIIGKCLEQRQVGALFMIDIDNFKGVNDNLGHDVGDAVIQEVAQKLRYVFMEQDVIGRVGGDEFMVFLRGVVDIESKAQHICHVIRKTYSDGEKQVTISASIGIAKTYAGATFEELYKKADMAVYDSKRKGKNTYTIQK
ncbi:MAG: hypothetical protein ATN35_11130 [Epulopiscium sp. Nele67-Bin004]|nr:MAG: hypothetical protein ATN35_11130 [Epulopiscium sp. Nele67-Bin004]